MGETSLRVKQRLFAMPVVGKIVRLIAAIKNSNLNQHRILVLEQQIDELTNNIFERQRIFKINMARTLAQKQDISSASAAPAKTIPLPNNLDNLYIAFEDQFRGSADEIRQKQVKYLPFLAAVAQATSEPIQVLDIGCGRGEWLQLLTEHGYNARGIDISQTMVDYCRLEGLTAEQGDALSYLNGLDDASLHIISAFHVIEHLSFEQMVGLFDACLRVLKPGGKIIFETPNPENLTVGAYTFYLDPTHRNPLPPVMVEFVARQRGFQHIDIYRYNPRDEVGESSPLVEQWFKTPVDFAIVAEK